MSKKPAFDCMQAHGGGEFFFVMHHVLGCVPGATSLLAFARACTLRCWDVRRQYFMPVDVFN
jgi:hypothetical protein